MLNAPWTALSGVSFALVAIDRSFVENRFSAPIQQEPGQECKCLYAHLPAPAAVDGPSSNLHAGLSLESEAGFPFK